jgi:hypothetical protein
MNYNVFIDGFNITYTERNKILRLLIDMRDYDVYEWSYSLKSIIHWESPYEYEEISIEDKEQILKNIQEFCLAHRYAKIKFDFSKESNKVSLNEILSDMKRTSGWTYSPKMQGEKNWDAIDFGVYLNIRDHNKLSEEDKLRFHNFLLEDEKIIEETRIEKLPHLGPKSIRTIENYKISRLLKDFAKHKVENFKEKSNQNLFTFGLYALDMVLTQRNRGEIKEILKQYIEISKEKNLSFEEFMSESRPLNELIVELSMYAPED